MSEDRFERLLEDLIPGAGRQDTTDAEAPLIPHGLGLELRGLIGRGGTGQVYRAWDPVLEREVALKVARPDSGAAGRAALLAEARRTAQLRHPAVLPVHRVMVHGGQLYVEYALAPETTMDASLADPEPLGGRTLSERLVLLRGLSRALALAHDGGLIHGDLHPCNVALGPGGATWLLDWSPPGEPGTLSGAPSHAAPELLHGQPPTPASDVYSLGVMAWELTCLRPMRPRLRGEDLGAYVARWRDRPAPPLRTDEATDPALAALLQQALSTDPGQRPTAEAFAEALDEVLSGSSRRHRRAAQGEAMLQQGRAVLGRYRELGLRLEDEQRVVTVLTARIPPSAPPDAKHTLWEAEARVRSLELERARLWLEAVRVATIALTLDVEPDAVRAMLAELWWWRMEDQQSRGQHREVHVSRAQILQLDPERRGAMLRAPARLHLTTPPGATLELSTLAEVERRLLPQPQPQHTHDLPAVVSLPTGRYHLTVRRPGCVPLISAALLQPGEELHLTLTPRPQPAIGEGFVLIPAGPFRLGGDPQAPNALERCRPTLGDRFMAIHPVTCAEYRSFLHTLPADEAAARQPGVSGLGATWWPCWSRDAGGQWQLPEGWQPDSPVVGVRQEDAEAYAAWRSAVDGRPLRLPTEEEWEKAARGPDGRPFPWGDQAEAGFAAMALTRTGPVPVSAFPHDRSLYGCRHLAGNVAEWTRSRFDQRAVVVRGGAWTSSLAQIRCAARRSQPPERRSLDVGFRLVSEHPLS